MVESILSSLDVESEQFGAYGNVASQGILNQLGRPDLDLLSVLMREAVQNSWDARLSDEASVRFGVTGRTLSDDQLTFLQNTVLANKPAHPEFQAPLFSSREVQVLTIYDRGTTGLNGPTRANAPDDGTGSRNFANFFRNVGQSKTTPLGGGTYGYGKSVLYRASQISTICVHTRCKTINGYESRFIVAALEPLPEDKKKINNQYTGRHWWGRLIDKVIEPVIGNEADTIAHQLGFLKFADTESGTSCMVLLPVTEEFSLSEVMHRITRNLLWYFWPKMLMSSKGITPIEFEVFCEDEFVPLPDPHTYPPLQGFVEAMENLKRYPIGERADAMHRITTISSATLKKELGRLSLQKFPFQERPDKETDSTETFPPIKGMCQHVALMRNAELIVKYLKCDSLSSSLVEYAGVFVVDKKIDAAFAKAEPPTHDNWSPQYLTEQWEKTCVNAALRQIIQATNTFTTPLPTAGKNGTVFALGGFADQLGSLIVGEYGPGGYVQLPDEKTTRRPPIQPVGGNKKGTGPKPPENQPPGDPVPSPSDGDNQDSEKGKTKVLKMQPEIIILGEGKLDIIYNTPVLITEFSVEHGSSSPVTQVEVEANIVLDNGELEKEPPSNSSKPEVLLWIDAEERPRSGSDAIRIPSSDTGKWKVAVTIPENTVINVSLSASEVHNL